MTEHPYDLPLIYGQFLKRFQKHSKLAVAEIHELREKLMRTEMELDIVKAELESLKQVKS